MNIQDSIIFFMEILGTIAFAASGAMVGDLEIGWIFSASVCWAW